LAKRKPSAKRTEATGATIGYEAQLWQMADALRGSMDAAEYKHVVLGLIFLKYISDAFEERHATLVAEQPKGADPEDPDEYRALSYVGAEAQADDGEPFAEKMQRLAAQLREQQAEAANRDAAIAANLKELGYGSQAVPLRSRHPACAGPRPARGPLPGSAGHNDPSAGLRRRDGRDRIAHPAGVPACRPVRQCGVRRPEGDRVIIRGSQ
jgi:type I restriction enzyme M protein